MSGNGGLANGLIASVHSFLAGVADPEFGVFLADWPGAEAARRRIVPRPLPVLRWLDDLPPAAAPETRGLVAGLLDAGPLLAWEQTYVAGDVDRRFLDRYGWTELIGLRGPVGSERLACGFLLLGPEAEYPLHSHAAAEFYLPLAGRAEWLRGEEPWVPRPPGTPIHHPSWMPHAMRTGAAPLLALYLWRGDLARKSTMLPTAPSGPADGRRPAGRDRP